MLFNIVLCCVVCHVVDSSKASNPVRNKSDIIIRPDSRGDYIVVLVYLPIVLSKLHLAKFIDYSGLVLLFRKDKSVNSVRVLIVAAGMFMYLMLRSNIVRILI